MPTRSADYAVGKAARAHAVAARRRGGAYPRMPSTAGYMVAAVAFAVAIFLTLWWVLREGGDEAPWLPSGLAAGVVILIAAAAREVAMRRAWARYTRELEVEMRRSDAPHIGARTPVVPTSMQASAAALRALQQRLAEIEAAGSQPETHLEAYRLCEQYLTSAEEALRSAGAADVRAALRAGQERVRALQRHHLLAWVRTEATRLTQEAQRRVRASDRIETAQRALEVIGEALRVCPEEPELRESSLAVRNFIASVKVGQWVEMAERSAFRGRYARAIARYRDALFYLSRADMGEDARGEAADRIQREIELLRARLATGEITAAQDTPPRRRGPKRERGSEPRASAAPPVPDAGEETTA